MERVFYNLLLNAAQATPPGGAITRQDAPVARRRSEISVIDRGSGIAPEHLESIFNPFFTTKPEGVGLGLAIVSKIVDEHGGTITVGERTVEGHHLSRVPAGGASASEPGLLYSANR